MDNDSPEAAKGRKQSEVAIQQIGTNGIPILLEMLTSTNSPWKLRVNFYSPKPFRFTLAEHKRGAAVQGFVLLKENALPAVPSLIKLLSAANPQTRAAAATALAGIKPQSEQAVDALVRGIVDNDRWVTYCVIRALGQIHHKPELAVPALVRHLQSPNPHTLALSSLAAFGEEAQLARPTVVAFLVHTNESVRQSATNALRAITPSNTSPASANR